MERLKLEYINPEYLKEHPENPKIHPESQIQKIINSIQEYGFTNPIIATTDNYILSGNGRLRASLTKGVKEVPVIYIPLEKSDAKAYMVANNRIQELGEWDLPRLQKIFSELEIEEFQLDITGFDNKEIDRIFESMEEKITSIYNIKFDDREIKLTKGEFEDLKKLVNEYLKISMTKKRFIMWLYNIKGNRRLE